ncbi:MAG TPA: DUF1329 domain-containing protein [Candidatus Binatia bacterium]
MNTIKLSVALSLLLLAPFAARADVKPGDKIGPQNVAQIKDLVSPGIVWCVEHGMPMTIVETKPITLPRAYREATEKYSGQVKLSADGRRLEGWVAGLPFPNIDPNDPLAATKIAWNFDRRFAITDDFDARNFDADVGTVENDREMTIERHYLLDHLRRLMYVGRLYVDPKPEMPSKEQVQYRQSLHPILEPFDLKGVGVTSYRYLDPDKQDDSWLYLPSLRRVRRLSAAQRSDALFGQDTDLDSYYGYDGHPAWMDWTFLGEKEVLGVMHGRNFPVKWAEGRGSFAFDEDWEKRKVWVVEARSKFPQYAYSKRIIFIDKEAWVVLYSDIYDRSGNLWKVWVNDHTFRKETPVGKVKYEDEMAFGPAIMMVDVQASHATRAALPSPRFPGEEGLYFNQGEKSGTTEQFFTIAALVESAR